MVSARLTPPAGPPGHPAAWPPDELLSRLEIQRFKARGPGGQHRNKVETGVRLIHAGTGLTATAVERRSGEQNRKVALWRLRVALALEHRTPLGGWPAIPSELWRRRTAGSRLAVAAGHDDVPALLAEALDVLAALDDELPRAAERLGVSTTRLVKVVKLAPEALRALNRRLERGQRPTWR